MRELRIFLPSWNKVYLIQCRLSRVYFYLLRRLIGTFSNPALTCPLGTVRKPSLTVDGDADAGTVALDWALAAEGRDWFAEILAEGNQQVIPFDPVLGREALAQGLFCFFGSLGPDKAETV